MLQIALIWPWAVEVWDTRESQQRLCFISAGSHEDDLLFEKCCSETGVGSRLGASGNTSGPQAPANAASHSGVHKKSSGLAVSHVSIFLLSGS